MFSGERTDAPDPHAEVSQLTEGRLPEAVELPPFLARLLQPVLPPAAVLGASKPILVVHQIRSDLRKQNKRQVCAYSAYTYPPIQRGETTDGS